MVRNGGVLSLFLCVAAVPFATAQTLQSITINGAPSGNFYTGAFVELTATGSFTGPSGPITAPVYVNWTSSDSTVVSVDNTSGVATALKASVTPITITATAPGSSVAPASIEIPIVLPQTALYAADGNTLTVGDVTYSQDPTLVTTVNYLTSTGTVNGNNAVPIALSNDERYLFIASPGYYSSSSSNFTVVAIDTQTFEVAATISSSLLCYPTSIAVAGGNLYVVNAGPSVAKNGAATDGGCASNATEPVPNVQMYSIADIPQVQAGQKTWTPGTNVTQAANSSSTDAFTYIPISVAASADQVDSLVYVGSVAGLSGSTFDAGLISSFTSGSTALANQTVMHTADKLAVAPLGMTVLTSYPSWAAGAVHTVAFAGPGTVGSKSGEYLGYFSDACDSGSPSAPGCPGNTIPATVAFPDGAATTSPFWLSTGASPDGHGFYAAINDYLYSFSATDGTSTTGFVASSSVFDTEGVGAGQCDASCLPVTSVTTKSDQSKVYVASIGQVDVLNPNGLVSTFTASPIQARGFLVSQHPEINLTLQQSGNQILSASFVVSGNFQNTSASASYPASCVWGAGQPTWNGFESSSSEPPLNSTGGTVFPQDLPTYDSSTTGTQVVPAITDVNDPLGSIIVGISVGPVTTTLTEDSLTVALGASDNVSAQVTNAYTDSTVTWQLKSFPTCTSQGAQGASCPLGVIVANGNSVTYYAPATMPSTSLGSPVITATPDADTTDQAASASVTLTLVTPPTGTYQPTSLTFPAQTIQTTSTAQTVTLTNTGQQDLALTSAPVIAGTNSSDFAVSSTTCTLGLILTANANCSISVTFTPTATGARSATLQVTDNSGGTAGTVQSLNLSGTGQNPGLFMASPTSLTFAAQTLQTTSAPQTVTVTNTGQSSFTLVSASIALPSDFSSASGTTCTANLSIAPNSSCVVNVTFTPTATGTRNGTLTITYNLGVGSNSTQDVTLTGTGQNPGAITPNPASLTFAAQTLQTTSAAQTVTVTNTGQASLTLVSALIGLPSDFATASGTTCTPNLSLVANDSCVIKVTFTPTATGTRNGTITLTYNTGVGPNATQNVTLAGTGQSPGAAMVNPTSLTFAAQTLQTTSAAQTITVTNTGQANLTLVSSLITLPSDFATASGTTCTANLALAANASCVIKVTFTPTATGTRNGTLTITYNTGVGPDATQNVTLTGTGQQAPAVNVSPASLTFTAEAVGATSAAQPITVTNSGQVNLTLGAAPAITGANAGDFAIAAGTTCTASLSLAPGGSCAINVTFIPTAAGTRSATVVVTDNAGGTAGATQSVSLSGSAISITLFPANPQLEAGTTQTFLPNILPSSASGPVTWSVSGTGCGGHACGSIDANGNYTVPSSLGSPATDTIKAVLNSNTAVFGTTEATLFLKPVLSIGGTATVQAGQAATYSLSILGGTGDALSPLRIQCLTETLPNGVTCQSVSVQPGATTVNFTFTVQTTGQQSAAIRSSQVLLGGFVLLVPFCCFKRFRKQVKGSSLILAVVAIVALSWIGLTGCGTNGSFGSTTTKNFGGTPPGAYTLQLQGTGPSGTPENIGTVGLVVQ